jgi:GT2 family glycosyltransferase
MALGIWGLLRYQSRLFRSSSGAFDQPNQVAGNAGARWMGNTSIRGRSRHALSCPPGSRVVYRFVAPPFSRVVAWCAFQENARTGNGAGAEFVIAVRNEASGQEQARRLLLKPDGLRRDRSWRKLVLRLRNREPQQIEVTLTTLAQAGADSRPIWGEPRLEWRRPFSETKAVLQSVSHQALNGNLIEAARTLHGRLSASSNPSQYQLWLSQRSVSSERLARLGTAAGSMRYRPLVSIVTPVYNTDARWLTACIESVKNQAYPHWRLCLADDGSTRAETLAVLRKVESDPRIRITRLATNAGIATASNAALALADGEFVAFLDHDDEIPPDALFEVVALLNEQPDTDFIYTDEDKLELDGTRGGVYFKPDWSHDHFLTNMYTCHLMVVRRTLLDRIGGFRSGYDGAQDYDLVLRIIEQSPRIRHLSKVLYHWRRIPESTAGSEGAKPWAHDAGKLALEDYVRRNGLDAEVLAGALPYVYRVRLAIRGQPLVSIVLPAVPERRTDVERQRACDCTLRTLAERTRYRRFEVILPVVGERSCERDLRLPHGLEIRTVSVGAAAQGRLQQQALAAAGSGGDHLLFLDWGLQALDREWLNALLEYSQQAAIGAVGAKLLYPDGSLEHIGILLGVNGVAAPALHRHPGSSLGYWGTAVAARNYSAVTGACMMTRRDVFEQIGGFREAMGSLADVDYCLRAGDAGYRIVFTPHASLVRAESVRPGGDVHLHEHADRFRTFWGDRLTRDPFYNANFSRDSPDYEPEVALVEIGMSPATPH